MKDDNLFNEERDHIEVITYIKKEKEPRVGTVRMMMRLALGSVVIGREEMKNRFQAKQSETAVPASALNEVTPIETDTDRIRYAAVGAVAKSSDAFQGRISALERTANKGFGMLSRAFRPLSNSRLMRPVHRQYQRYVDHGDKVVSDWVAAGRREEYLSKQLVQDTATEAIEETLDYFAESPEMDELVQQQSVDLIEDVFEDVGDRTSSTGMIMVDWLSGMIMRKPRKKSVASPPSQASQAPSGTEEKISGDKE